MVSTTTCVNCMRPTNTAILADIARLEWLIQNALLAAEHAPLDLTKLAAVEETAYDELCFELHPTLRLFSSPYPALRIWQANANSDAEPESIDLDSGGDRIAVMRSRLQLTVHQLSPGEQALLGALRRGTPFAAAVAAGAAGRCRLRCRRSAAAICRRRSDRRLPVDRLPVDRKDGRGVPCSVWFI